MARLPNGNDDLTKIRAGLRAERRIAWLLLATIFVVAALFFGVTEFHLPMESTGIAAFAVLLLWIAVVFRTQRRLAPVGGYNDEEILRKTIDDQHRRWRWLYAFMFVAVGGLASAISLALSRPDTHSILSKGSPFVVELALYLAIAAVVGALQICFGPGFLAGARRRALNDELTRAMQRGAAMFGYVLSVAAMCGVLAATMIRPQWGLAVMPGAISAAVILPGLYFLILQWRAGRDG